MIAAARKWICERSTLSIAYAIAPIENGRFPIRIVARVRDDVFRRLSGHLFRSAEPVQCFIRAAARVVSSGDGAARFCTRWLGDILGRNAFRLCALTMLAPSGARQ